MRMMRDKGYAISRRSYMAAALVIALIAFACIGIGIADIQEQKVYAYTIKRIYLVSEKDVYVRSGPGTTYNPVKTTGGSTIFLQPGAILVAKDEKKDSSGNLWYQVSFVYAGDSNAYDGYVYGAFFEEVKDTSGDDTADFEEKLEKEGFPESYKDKLRVLHELYPLWEFKADHLNYTWEEALNNQSIVGRSLVPSYSIFSWKSTETGAYDWATDTWYGMDGSSWVAASKEMVAYCMDPRNFLDATQIFQFEQLSYSSTQNKEGLKNVIANSFLENNSIPDANGNDITYLDALMAIGMETGISPYHLAARIIQEIGRNGASGSISGTYGEGLDGYYNYYNIGAFTYGGNSAIKNGLIYASQENASYGRPWNTRWKALLGGAMFIGTGYINIGQDTSYYVKFDYVGTPYTHQYMTSIQAPQSEARISSKAYSNEMKLNSAFVFKIPVFKDMPEEPAKQPTDDKNNNYYMGSLGVSAGKLSPAFDYRTASYTVTVPYSQSSIDVTASTASKKSSVSGAGSYTLKVGSNVFYLVVTAENGSQKTYKLTVIREEKPAEPPTTTPPTTVGITASTGYTVTDKVYLTGLSFGLNVDTLLKKGTYTNCTAKVLNYSGAEKGKTAAIATGDQLSITKSDGGKYASYTLLLYGDPTCDGSITVKDILLAKKHILSGNALSGVTLLAADADRNGSITVKDLLLMKYQVLGKSTIRQ